MSEGHFARNTEQREKSVEELDREWGLFTIQLKQAVVENPQVRATVKKCIDIPLSQEFVMNVIAELEVVDASLTEHISPELLRYITEYFVDEEQLTPDIANAREISRGFKTAVGRKYIYARSLKRLAIAAEFIDNPVNLDQVQKIGKEARDGLTLTIAPEKPQAVALCNPANWERVIQLKDRVYRVILADGSQCILKERKTDRHLHTLKDGHRDGLTIDQEFATSRFFESLGVQVHGDVELQWEKPLGYVQTADGYSFALFEHIDHMFEQDDTRFGPGSNDAYPVYVQEIQNNIEEYPEYGTVIGLAEVIIDTPELFGFEYQKKVKKQPFTATDFAYAKMEFDRYLLNKTIADTEFKHGFSRGDRNKGLGIRVYAGGEGLRPKIEGVTYDLEYHRFVIPPERRAEYDYEEHTISDIAWELESIRYKVRKYGINVAAILIALYQQEYGALFDTAVQQEEKRKKRKILFNDPV